MDFQELLADLEAAGIPAVATALAPLLDGALDPQRHGDLPRWLDTLAALPALEPRDVRLDAASVSVGSAADIDAATSARIEEGLRTLMPWRKGPFTLYGVHIDTEWRSDLKWDRLRGAIAPLAGRRVLDVGCGSGYHCWRMRGEGASVVLGIDPTLLFNMQYRAVRHFTGPQRVHVAPLGIQDLPPQLRAFDTVFSMGVLYHRRSPIDHLLQLRDCLRPGGELVLETLVVEGGADRVLVPGERYAKMRNVWFIPSPDAAIGWLERCGFRDIHLVDVGPTTTEEQRRTGWMSFESLADFLDPADPGRTVEGYPAPRRAVLLATSP